MTPENIPTWLANWTPRRQIAMKDFFASRVVFYPGAGTDGQPVAFFGSRHAAHCFVLADYGLPKDQVVRELAAQGHPFTGYTTIGRKELSEHDLTPNGWRPTISPARATRPAPVTPYEAYAFLEILERQNGFDDSHGPRRLAILFLGGDGVASYDALFCQPGARAPFAVVLQDHGLGGNWTKFGEGGCLEQLARKADRLPPILLVADNTDAWPGYSVDDDIPASRGGMHGHTRRLWQQSGDRKDRPPQTQAHQMVDVQGQEVEAPAVQVGVLDVAGGDELAQIFAALTTEQRTVIAIVLGPFYDTLTQAQKNVFRRIINFAERKYPAWRIKMAYGHARQPTGYDGVRTFMYAELNDVGNAKPNQWIRIPLKVDNEGNLNIIFPESAKAPNVNPPLIRVGTSGNWCAANVNELLQNPQKYLLN
jgi:hypothetical protein